ncbi:MAG: hypothetical protein V1934_08720 [Methanobacteriota archaeon]
MEADVLKAEIVETGKEGNTRLVDTDRLGQSFMLLGAIVLFIHLSLTVLSLAVPAESSWMVFNMWGINRFVSVTVVCCVIIAIGWMLCRKAGCSFLGDEPQPVPGEKNALPDVREPQ